ncbi:hypothetical protein BT093_11655, partial [Corynebacterium diphtheriae]
MRRQFFDSNRRLMQQLIHHTANSAQYLLSLIHITEPTRRTPRAYAGFCMKKKRGGGGGGGGGG